jgi:hypothetical protein
MSELKQALDAILRVNFREPVPPSDQSRLAAFLERAAMELQAREQAVADREVVVSQREANVQVRENESVEQIKALTSMRRVAGVLDLQPVKLHALRRWMPGRR